MTAFTSPSAASDASQQPLPPRGPRAANDGTETLNGLLDALRTGLDSPCSDSAQTRAIAAAVADAIGGMPRPPAKDSPLGCRLVRLAEDFLKHPASAAPVADELPASAATLAAKGWTSVPAAIFRAPAWQNPATRGLADLAPALWTLHARYLFAAPAISGNAAAEESWAAHILRQLEALAGIVEANRGSAAVHSATRIALELSGDWPGAGTAPQSRERARLLGRLRLALSPRMPAFAATPRVRAAGEPLRVGVVRDVPDHGDMFSETRLGALLDPERFSVSVRMIDELPEGLGERLATLRELAWDAAIFAGDLTSPDSPLAPLALHRIAPLQVASAFSPVSSGLREIDLFLGDALNSPQAHAERLAILPSALAFAPIRQADGAQLTRADLGLPETGALLAATASWTDFNSATLSFWRNRLGEDSSARLILLPGETGDKTDAILAAAQAAIGERIILAGREPLEAPTLAALLGVCDLYLAGRSVHDRLAGDIARGVGIPAVSPDGETLPRTDELAFADALASVLEQAGEELARDGRRAFANNALPLRAAAVQPTAAERHVEGWRLLTSGRPDRAVVRLMAAVDDPSAGPEVWHDLSLALHDNGQHAEAVQAMETCVRMAPERIDSWIQLARWAEDLGHVELVGEIDNVLRKLAPADPRVISRSERLAS